MAIPTHGPDCSTRTFETKCKYCRDEIFFISCTCGSRLLVNELGHPWPPHSCADYIAGEGRYRLGKEVFPIAQLWNRGIRANDLQDFMPGTLGSQFSDANLMDLPDVIDQSFDPSYVRRVKKAAADNRNKNRRTSDVTRQDPYHGVETSEIGKVVDLISDANIAKKAGVKSGSLGASALGQWANQKLDQVTIHTGALGDDEVANCSFTFFVEAGIVRRLGIRRDSVVSVILRGIVVLSSQPIWVCEELIDLLE